MDIKFNILEEKDFHEGHKIICDAVNYLLSRNIRQWTKPLPIEVYR